MRYAIFSDAHGNIDAVNAMFMKAEKMDIDKYIFCGDIIGYFHQTTEVIKCLRQNRVLCIKGNHDAQYINALSDAALRENLAKRYGRSYMTYLPKEYIIWLRNLPYRGSLSDEYASILFLHGSLKDALEGRVYPDTRITDEFIDDNYTYIIMGHTHYRMNRNYKNVILLNPGSIGQPRDKQGFSFMVLDTLKGEVGFHNISLDIKKLRKKVIQNENISIKNKKYLLKKMEEI